jgi:hypothetical protein
MPNQPQSGLRFDPTDLEYAPLLKAAGRVAALLETKAARQDDLLGATLDLFLGALYAFALAKHDGYEHRTGPADPAVVITRARDFDTGWVRLDGKWIAGFHFNSAILRIAAVYHRALKIALNKPTTQEYVPALREPAKSQYPGWTDDNAWVVHQDVNALKHDPAGRWIGRLAKPEHASGAIEEILTPA